MLATRLSPAVGDPTGRGWVGRCVAAAYDAGTAVTPYNLGVRGDTSRDVLERWEGEARPRLAAEAAMRVVFSPPRSNRSDVWRDEAARGDGAHPRAGGYELLAELIRGPWLTWLQRPTAP